MTFLDKFPEVLESDACFFLSFIMRLLHQKGELGEADGLPNAFLGLSITATFASSDREA